MRKKFLKSKMIGVITVILALFMAVGVAEEEITDASGLWKYVLEDDGTVIVGCMEPRGEVTLPSKLSGYPVTGIGDRAFESCDELTGIVISKYVTTIGEEAFHGCTRLTGVTFSKSVERIGRRAFRGCVSLESITLPGGLKVIEEGAFNGCGLTDVRIPSAVESIGINPFIGCPMKSIGVASANPYYEKIDGVLFDKRERELVAYPTLRWGACAIPEGTLRIGSRAFYYCENLSEITIPDSVTDIGDQAITGCEKLVGLIVTKDSYAEQYAKENNISYVLAAE